MKCPSGKHASTRLPDIRAVPVLGHQCVPWRLAFISFLVAFVLVPHVTADVPALQDPHLISDALLQEGWISLFDGQTLYGWQPTSNGDWRVEDGAIVVSGGEPGFLKAPVPFRNFELSLQFRGPAETNSGVFVRSAEIPTNPAKDCLEINIAPATNPFPTGSFVGRVKTAVALPVTDPKTWQTMVIRAEGPRVEVTVDGQPTAILEGADSLRGDSILLQLNQGRVEFREIRVRPLGLSNLLTGNDLSGWKSNLILESHVDVESNGELHVFKGPGQLESVREFGDFVLQFECQTHAPGLNSGIFFRCIPGDRLMGYESQISNAWKEDRSHPADAGTGGIFRRQEARYVPADDQKWFWNTIVAKGPRLATWVNGLQVCDWTDTRKPDPNPRRGLRLQPGTLMIQAHDATTDVSFRNLRIAELEAAP